MSRSEKRRQADQAALELLKYCRAMSRPAPDETRYHAARILQKKINRVVLQFHELAGQPPGPGISPKVAPELEPIMAGLAETLSELLTPLGYCLFVFEFGDQPDVSYVTNANPDDMTKLLQQFVNKYQGLEE